MKLLILGASKAQLIGITTAKAMGHEVVTCDYLQDSIGHKYSDVQSYESTFDHIAVLRVAKEEQIDGIMTLGTDQPVYTAAYVAEAMGLPLVLSEQVALSVTNKKVMKAKFVCHGIPTTQYVLYKKGHNESDLDLIDYPVVVKPIDSQGQRGIYYLETKSDVINRYEDVIMYSRSDEILVETYYEHDEMTVSGWVKDSVVYTLSITDRVTFSDTNQLGICLSHEMPSSYMSAEGEEIMLLTKAIVKAFEITSGPIYFQYLRGSEGLKVNEIACRIGGAYEATFIPRVTGFDICKAAIGIALGEEVILNHYNVLTSKKVLSVQLFFSSPCSVRSIPEESLIRSLEGVIDYGIHYKAGDVIGDINNATSRAGYVIIEAPNKDKLEHRIKEVYKKLRIIGADKKNHVIHRAFYKEKE